MFIWQLILSDHNVEPLYTTEIIPVEFYIICIYVSYMHGCILSYEREREKFVQENILLHIAIIAGFTSQIMHIKKKSERAMPSILPYIQEIYTKIRMSWVMLHLYIDRVPTFFFKGKVREFQNYLIYGNLIWFQKHFQIGFKFFNLINYLISNILMNAMLH